MTDAFCPLHDVGQVVIFNRVLSYTYRNYSTIWTGGKMRSPVGQGVIIPLFGFSLGVIVPFFKFVGLRATRLFKASLPNSFVM